MPIGFNKEGETSLLFLFIKNLKYNKQKRRSYEKI